MNPELIRELLNEYNADPRSFTDEQAEIVATLSKALGSDFNQESKKFRKGLFDFADTAAFGLIPNKLRPTSRGESIYGETIGEKILGTLGTGSGALASGGLAVKGARGITKGASSVFNNIRSKMKGTQSNPVSSVRDRVLQLGEGNQPLQLGEGQRLLSGQTNRQIRRNRFPLNSTSGQPIPMGSRSSQGYPMGGEVGLRDFSRTDAGRTYTSLLNLL